MTSLTSSSDNDSSISSNSKTHRKTPTNNDVLGGGPEDLVKMLHIFLSQRPEVDIPANYENLWLGDFETCLKTYSFEQVRLALIFSQLPRNQKYYVRSAGILKSLDSLIDQIEGVDDSAGVKRSLTVLWSQALKGQLPKLKTSLSR